MDGRGIETDLLPAKIDKLAYPQSMPERHQDHKPVADGIATAASRGHQAVDLGLSQVLALPVVSVLGSATANCRLFRL
jgi:hypothetical protein